MSAGANPPCTFTTVGTTMTLDATCDTTVPLPPIPNGDTVDGNGNTINFADPSGGHFSGAVLTNAGASMNIQNLTIAGPPSGLAVPTNCAALLFGILFQNASGTVKNVHVENVFQTPTTAFGNCQVGHAIRANGFTTPNTVTITDTMVTGYQKGGLTASGPDMTMNVSNSVIGPPASLEGFIAQNGVQYGGAGANHGAGGTIANSLIYGSGDEAPGVGGSDIGTAVLLFGATNVTVTNNTMTGPGTDIGVHVATDNFDSPNVPSTGIVISYNNVTRTAPDSTDPLGAGIYVCSSGLPACTPPPVDIPSSATLICNIFSGWNTNVVGAIQVGCTPLPPGKECQSYSAHVPTVEGGTGPFTWSATGLPPGLTLSPSGAITGSPTKAGTYRVTASVADSSSPPFTATANLSITIAAGVCSAISLVKSADVSRFDVAGTQITYTFTVTNVGHLPLDHVTISDPLAGLSEIVCPSALPLAPGRSMTCTAHYTTTQADVARGTIKNTATATGTAAGFHAVTTKSTVVVQGPPTAPVAPITPTTVPVTG